MSETSKELSHEELQKVIASIDIPTCPASVTEAMTEAQKDEPDLNSLSKIIANDPGMSAAALKLANSPLYRSSGPVTSLRKAVDRLGTKNVVCVVVAAALRSSISGLPSAWLEEFWRRSTLLAVISAQIAKRQFGISPDAAYTYALFHDAAIPLMKKRFPEYDQVLETCAAEGKLIVVAEEAFFPCSHPVVGSLLIRNWGLPPLLGQAIRFHHDPEAYDLPDRTLPGGALSFIAVTHVAEHLIAEVLGYSDLEVGSALYARALDYLGIAESEMDELRALVTASIEEFDG